MDTTYYLNAFKSVVTGLEKNLLKQKQLEGCDRRSAGICFSETIQKILGKSISGSVDVGVENILFHLGK